MLPLGTSMDSVDRDTDCSSSSDLTCNLTELNLSDEEEFIGIDYIHVSDQDAQEEATKLDPSYDLYDESKRLLKEIQIAMETVRESNFYSKLIDQVEGDEFQEQLKSFLGTNSSLNMVIYALGDLEFTFKSHYQLATALLLKERCSWIEDIEVYDPAFVRADIIVLKELECNVLLINEKARRRVERPTLFFIPNFPPLMGNLLEANWCPSQVNQILVLMNIFKDQSSSDEFVEAIRKYTIEIPIRTWHPYDVYIYGFACNFFKVDSQLDMDDLLSYTCIKRFKISKSERLKRRGQKDETQFEDDGAHTFTTLCRLAKESFLQPYSGHISEKDWSYMFMEYRGPREYRCRWHAPPKGWIKLNIGAIRRESKIVSGYGGICHNEHIEPLLVYNGSVEKVDEFAACVQALKFLQKFKPTKIIVESDNLKFIQWVNRWHPRGYQVEQSLQVVRGLLQQFDSYVVCHVYEEAIRLAEHGRKECL